MANYDIFFLETTNNHLPDYLELHPSHYLHHPTRSVKAGCDGGLKRTDLLCFQITKLQAAMVLLLAARNRESLRLEMS